MVEFLAILLVLLSVFSLSATIGVTNLDSLKLVLDGPDFVFEAKVLHLHLEDTDYVLDLGVVFHGQILRKW